MNIYSFSPIKTKNSLVRGKLHLVNTKPTRVFKVLTSIRFMILHPPRKEDGEGY